MLCDSNRMMFLASKLDAFCYSTLDILERSLSLAKIAIGGVFIRTIFPSVGKIPMMQRSMYVGPK